VTVTHAAGHYAHVGFIRCDDERVLRVWTVRDANGDWVGKLPENENEREIIA
jgi:hypothetical protein